MRYEDPTAVDEDLTRAINGAGLCLLISIGHRVGLFDALASHPNARVEEIASYVQCHESYVAEWLASMVSAGFVRYDERLQAYNLCGGAVAMLCRSSYPNNLSVYTQYIAFLGSVEAKIVDAMKVGYAISYDDSQRFHEIIDKETQQTLLPYLKSHVLAKFDGLIELLTDGARVLDVGCGRGRAIVALSRWFPRSDFVGIDVSTEAISFALQQTRLTMVENAAFVVADILQLAGLEQLGKFDLVTSFEVMQSISDPLSAAQNIKSLLRKGGSYLSQEVNLSSNPKNNKNHPLSSILYAISLMHCLPISLGRPCKEKNILWGKEYFERVLQDAGFKSIRTFVPQDNSQNYYILTS